MAQKFLSRTLGVDGTAAAPSLSFTSDTDTGMYWGTYSGTDRMIAFSTEGTQRAYIASLGIVSQANVYTAASGSFRNYSGTWSASTGLTGNGFSFLNSVDGEYAKMNEHSLVLFQAQTSTNKIILSNNRQDAGNVPVSSIVGKNGGNDISSLVFSRGAGGNSGYAQIWSRPNNDTALSKIVQFGEDNSLETTFAGNVVIGAVDAVATGLNIGEASPTIQLFDTTNDAKLLIYTQDSSSIVGTYSNHPLALFTNSTQALNLDTSQNAVFAGKVKGLNFTSTENAAAGGFTESRDYLIAGTGDRGAGLVINDISGAKHALFAGGHDLTFAKEVNDGAGNLSYNVWMKANAVNASGYVTSLTLCKDTDIQGILRLNRGTGTAAALDLRRDTTDDNAIISDTNWMSTAAEGTDDRLAVLRVRTVGGTDATRGGKYQFYTRTTGSAFNLTTYDTNGQWTFPSEIEAASLDINGVADILGATTVQNNVTINKSQGSSALTINSAGNGGWTQYASTDDGIYGYIGTGSHLLAPVVNDNDFVIRAQEEFAVSIAATEKFRINASGNSVFVGTLAASNLSGTNTGDQTLPTDFYSVAAANAKFTSTDATGDDYTFEVEDEGNLSGNRWYHIATMNNHNGGLHMRGYISNHVENFSSQKLDIAIGSREGSDGAEIEITGNLDVLHSGANTDKCGIRVIKFEDNAVYDGYKIYVRTCRYSMLTLRLTQQGSITFNTSHGSPLTSEPAAIGGITAELDTSATAEGNYVLDDSAIKEIFHEGHKPTFAEIETTPTTISGYGITDALTIGTSSTTAMAGNTTIPGAVTDFVSKANGGTFSGDLNVFPNAGTGTFRVGRYAGQEFKLHSTDHVNTLTSINDADENQTHDFILDRVHAGTGANNFIIQKDGTSQLLINKDGQVTIAGNAIISGNLTVDGTTTTLNTQTVEVEDNILQLNTTQGSPDTATAATSGISVYRGDGVTQASLIFNEANDIWNLTNNLVVAGDFTASGYVQATSYLYVRDNIRLLNKAASNWLTFANRNTAASEAVYDLAHVGTISTSGTATIGGDADITSDVTIGGDTTITGSERVGSSSHGQVLHGSKSVSIGENTFTTVLTVSIANHVSCYVKIFATGDWSSHSAITYLGEFFLQNGNNAYAEPGMIIREVSNTKDDGLVSRIIDPTATTNPKDFEIQLKADDTIGSVAATVKITYEVMGVFGTVS